MELILFYISKSQNLLITFFILMFIIGIIIYLIVRDFRQDKKMKVFTYGLFLRMNNVDVLKLSIVVIRAFLAIYATIITDETIMLVCLIMIIILTIMYIVLNFKRVISEFICTLTQLVMIYFVYIINNYMVEVERTSQMLLLKICLTILIIIFTFYLLFDNIDIIAQQRVDKELKKSKVKKRKEEKLANGNVKK